MDKCVFCAIAAGELPAYKVWENTNFLAFLDIFPKIEGQVVLISKKHMPSYLFKLPKSDRVTFFEAATEVASFMDEKLGSERTALRMEGLELDHAHLKLYPVYSRDQYESEVNEAPRRANDENLKVIFLKFRKGGED